MRAVNSDNSGRYQVPASSAAALARYLSSGGGGGSSSPAGAPSTGGGYQPVNSIIPDPAVYQGETAQALQAYQNALAAIAARRAGTLQNYGMTAQVDANGNLTKYGIDPNNQHGLIQQLLSAGGHDVDAANQNAVSRGLGTTGLGAQALTQVHQQIGAQSDQLGRQFVGEIGSEAQDQYGATSAYEAAKLQAQRDAIASAIQNGYFTPSPGVASAQPGALVNAYKGQINRSALAPTKPARSLPGQGTGPYIGTRGY